MPTSGCFFDLSSTRFFCSPFLFDLPNQDGAYRISVNRAVRPTDLVAASSRRQMKRRKARLQMQTDMCEIPYVCTTMCHVCMLVHGTCSMNLSQGLIVPMSRAFCLALRYQTFLLSVVANIHGKPNASGGRDPYTTCDIDFSARVFNLRGCIACYLG